MHHYGKVKFLKTLCLGSIAVLRLGQDFWGAPVSYLNFRGTFANSGGHTKSLQFLPVKLNTVFCQFQFIFFLFKFELDADSFGRRRGV